MSYIITILFTLISFFVVLSCLFLSYSKSNGEKFSYVNNKAFDNSFENPDFLLNLLFGLLSTGQLMYNFLVEFWEKTNDFVELRTAWLCSILGSLAVVTAGIAPAILLPVDSGLSLHNGGT